MHDSLAFEPRLIDALDRLADLAPEMDHAQIVNVATEARVGHRLFWRPNAGWLRIAVAVGAVATLAVTAAFVVNFLVNRPGLIGPAPTASPKPSPMETPSPVPTPSPTSSPATSGGMWPQATLEEARAAQERADAGDPDYTWQVDALIAEDISHSFDPQNSPFISRFLRDEVGWEEFIFNPHVGWDELYGNLVFVRCAPGETNEFYPDDERAGSCAPTMDELQFETVRLSLGQPVREESDGIWVVTGWEMDPPFAQADPRVVEANATTRLEEFLEARLTGRGAEQFAEVEGQRVFGILDDVPLLYGASTGDAYDRYEVVLAGGPYWPNASLQFEVRLFTDGDSAVVEQPFTWRDSGFFHDATETRENGQSFALPYGFFEGEVTLTAAKPWEGGFERDSLDYGDQFAGSGEEAIILVADPRSAAGGCGSGVGLVDAETLAASLQSDPDLQVTAPVIVNFGGYDGLQLDAFLDPGASECEGGSVLRLADGSDRRGANVSPGSRMRVYLFDMPQGSSMRTLGIGVVAPEARFDALLDAATPILESLELAIGNR